MPQTVLALLGIVLASVLMLNQSRSGIWTERQTESAEIQALASEIAMARLAVLETMPYDQAVVGGTASAPNDLTLLVGTTFTPSGADAPGDDLDDANGESAETTHQVRQGDSGGTPGGVRMRTSVGVIYVEESDGVTPSGDRTRFKRATVTVEPVDGAAEPVVLTQLFSCGSFCTW